MFPAHKPALLLAALTLATPATADAQDAAVVGTVYDSIAGGPLPGATVYLFGTSHRAVSDPDGRFRLDDVPPGDHSILFFHDRLGRLGVSTGPVAVTVGPGAEEEVSLATPSMGTVVRSQCTLEEGPDRSGALAGRVVDGDSQVPLGGAVVTLSWQEEGSRQIRRMSVETGPGGWYRTCSAPADVPVLLSGSFFGREAARQEVSVSEGGFTEAHVPLQKLASTHVSGQLVDNESGEAVEGAEAWLRSTSHRALSNSRGQFDLGDVPPGTYMLVTDHLAYGIKMDTLSVPSDQRLSVEMRLDTRPVEIAPLTVSAEAAPVTIDRRRGGIVITRDEIDAVRQQSRDASDVIRSLHIPGIVVRHNSSSGRTCVGFTTGQVAMNHDGCVSMLVYINDVRATDAELALQMPPDNIERMVVYKPLQAGNLFGLGGGNGVWMIYTRGN